MLNELSKEIHELAISKGWWEEERSFAEIIALCHSELSEALEEYRNGKPNLYYMCGEEQKVCDNCGGENCPYRDDKPEGIAVELADTIIRILDYCAKENIDIDYILAHGGIGEYCYDMTFPELITHFHWRLSKAYEEIMCYENDFWLWFISCMYAIQQWCEINEIDIYNIIRIKHDYNKTRPMRHGGKRI